MSSVRHLEELWPDPDRRDDASVRLLADVYAAEEPEEPERLTAAQRRVLAAASRGLEMKEIAVVVGVSYETVETHLKHARRRLRAKNTTHAVAEALRQGMLT